MIQHAEQSTWQAKPVMDKDRLGMLLFILSEAVFFGALILGYVYYRSTLTDVSEGAKILDVPLTALFSLALFASSFTIWQADRALKNEQHGRLAFWLGATIALGIVFLAGQVSEYLRLLNENVTISRDLFGSTFFTLTGFHGFHVFAGLVMLSILFGFAVKGQFKGPHSSAVESISLYWHFVDEVWVFVFSVVYLWTLIS